MILNIKTMGDSLNMIFRMVSIIFLETLNQTFTEVHRQVFIFHELQQMLLQSWVPVIYYLTFLQSTLCLGLLWEEPSPWCDKPRKCYSEWVFLWEGNPPPKTEGYPKWNFKSWNSIAFQSDIDHLLQMLDEKFCVKNGYSCCRVLGCHHQSFSSSMCHEEFEMTWVDFSFLVIKTIWFSLNFFSQSFGLWSLQLFNW